MTKKITFLIAAAVMLLTMMATTAMWGQTRTGQTAFYGFETGDAGWTATTFVTNNTAITAHGGSKYGATNGTTADVKYNSIVATPLSLTCYYSKTTTNTNASSKFLIQVSSNGSTWTTVATGLGMNQVTQGTWYELTADLSSYSNVYVRVRYDGTTGVRALDDITLTYDDGQAPSTDPVISFSPASVTLGDVLVNYQASTTFTVSQSNLEDDITLTVDNGSLDINHINQDADPATVTWTYTPTSAGAISATVTASSGETTQTLEISGTAIAPVEGYDVDFEYATNMYPNWTFDNMTTYQTGSITAHGGTYYGTTGGKTTASITTTSKVANPGTLTCYISKQSSNTTSSTWYIQVSENGSSWTEVENHSATSMSQGTWVEFSADLSSYTDVYVRVYYNGSTAIRNIDDLTLTTAAPSNIFTVTYDGNGNTSGSIPTDDNEYESGDEVTVLGNTGNLAKAGYVWAGWNTKADGTGTDRAEGSKFNISENTTLYAKWDAKTITTLTYSGTPTATQYVGQAFNPAGLTVTATFNDESQEDVTSQVVWTPNPLTIETTSVTGTYMGLSVVVEGITVTYAPGTQDNPYTVAQARAAIDAGTGLTGVYATGIVSEIVTPYSSQYHNISYNISSDGLTTNDQLQAYRGKSYNGANFTSEDDIQVGDIVVVYGNLKKYNDIYEFDANNQLVSLIRKVATPTFSPIAGDVAAGTEVTIACATNGATIYYTTDGTDPTTSSNVYSEPILVNAAITIKAFAWKDGSPSSDIVTAEYTIAAPVATPTFSVSEGTYNFAQSVEIECTTEGATIYYTTDGNDPTTESTEYTEAIVVNETMTIKAIGAKAGLANSEVASATYTMNIPVINASNVNLAYDATNGSIAYTLTNEVEGGVLTAVRTEGDWLTVGEVSAESVALTCTANEGEADRTATVTLTYNYETHTVTKVVTVTQAHFIVDYATLPFEFDGGYADIESIVGLTQEGIDSKDYSSSPKLKFNNTDDWLILKINERPGTLTFDIKGNTFSGGTFTVQTSEDGETYTDLATYSNFGTSGNDTKNEVFTNLGENVRYIKWIYTNKVSGNVGLGNIALAQYTVPVPSISADDVAVAYDATSCSIMYTINNYVAGTMVATTEADWISDFTYNQVDEIGEVGFTTAANTGAERSATVTLTYTYDNSKATVTKDVTVTQAGVPAVMYTVNFTLDGGTFVPNNDFTDEIVEIAAGTYNLPSATKAGFEFAGWNDGNATYEAEAEYTISADVEFTAQWTEVVGVTYELVVSTDDIVPDCYYLITSGTNSTVKAMAGQNTNNRAAVDVTASDGVISNIGEAIAFIISGNGTDLNPYTIYDENVPGYLYAAGTNSDNHLKTQAEINARAQWTITIDNDNKAIITALTTETDRKVIRYNSTSGSNGIFSCYGSTSQQPIYLFKKVDNSPSITADNVEIEHNETSGSIIYTINNYVEGTMVATTTADWISDFEYEQVNELGSVDFTATANTSYENRSATVTLTYTYGDPAATVTKDVTVTQTGAPIPTYTVSFDVDGGEFVPNDDFSDEIVEIEAGTYSLPSATKGGYTFDGWYDGDQIYAAGESYTVSDDVDFTATYTELQYFTIHFFVNGEADDDMDVVQGNPVELPLTSTLTPNGFAIIGWASELSSTEAVPNPYTPESEVTLYAILNYLYSEDSYELVTDASGLATGDIVVIAALNSDYAMSTTQNNNNRGQASIVKSGNQIALSDNVCEFVLGEGSVDDSWSFYDAVNEGYIYAASSSSNWLRTETELSANSSWSISIEGNAATITAQGSNTRNVLQYNSSSSIFSCYASASQQAVCIYKKNAAPSFNIVNTITEPDASMSTNIPETTCVVVEEGAVLTFTGTNEGTAANIVVQEGGQLIHTTDVEATLQKVVEAYTPANRSGDGWYMIATPVDNLPKTAVASTSDFDLFLYNEPNAMWYAHWDDPGFETLYRGKGYLYANAADVDLYYAGLMKATDAEFSVPLSYDCDAYPDMKGFNLVGNPFTRNLKLGDMKLGEATLTQFYVVNPEHTGLVTIDNNSYEIKPGEGFFVQAKDENQTLEFNPSTKGLEDIRFIKIVAGNENGYDNAYINIGCGNTLRKTNIANLTSVYVMDQGLDYSAARVEELAGNMPVHFAPSEDGFFTITVEAKNLENINFMHLIDNIENTAINLLAEPTYTFKAGTSDNEDRFTLVFDFNNYLGVNENNVNDSFVYQSGDELILNGEGTLQVFDMMGRFVMSKEISGSERISTSTFETGVYVLRFVGETVMTQKIVIE